jgi:hypothetical protein
MELEVLTIASHDLQLVILWSGSKKFKVHNIQIGPSYFHAHNWTQTSKPIPQTRRSVFFLRLGPLRFGKGNDAMTLVSHQIFFIHASMPSKLVWFGVPPRLGTKKTRSLFVVVFQFFIKKTWTVCSKYNNHLGLIVDINGGSIRHIWRAQESSLWMYWVRHIHVSSPFYFWRKWRRPRFGYAKHVLCNPCVSYPF